MVVEDHGLLAQSLRLALTGEGMSVFVPPLEPAEVLAMGEQERPDVVLLDLDLGPLGGDGSALIEPLALGGARVLVVTGVTDHVRLGGCLESGAHAVLSKAIALDDLVESVRRTVAGEAILPPGKRDEMLAGLRRSRADRHKALAPFETLTPRERSVLSAVMEGRTAAEIARDAFVSEATIRSQIRGVLTKLGVSSQIAATALARRVGWHIDG